MSDVKMFATPEEERRYVKECFEETFDKAIPKWFMGLHRREFAIYGVLFTERIFGTYYEWKKYVKHKPDYSFYWGEDYGFVQFKCFADINNIKVIYSRKKYIMTYKSEYWPNGARIPLFPYRRVQRLLNLEDRILQILMCSARMPEDEGWV